MTYHHHRFKYLNFQYLYPISCKIAKKSKSLSKSLPFLTKRYHAIYLGMKRVIYSRTYKAAQFQIWYEYHTNSMS